MTDFSQYTQFSEYDDTMMEAKELDRLKRYDEELTKVMNPDFKDWHQGSKEEYPELAAWVITNLREQLDWAYKEIDRLYEEKK